MSVLKHRNFWAALPAAAALGLLCSCAPTANVQAQPVWQGELAAAGAQLAFDCGMEVRTAEVSLGGEIVAAEHFYCAQTPVMLLSGVEEQQVTVQYARPAEGGYELFDERVVTPKIDYTFGETADGTLVYDFETVYYYLVTVATDAGTDRFVVLCETDAPAE